MLNRFKQLVLDLRSTNSSSEKKKVLEQYGDCTTLLNFALDPYKKYGLTSKQLIKRKDLNFNELDNVQFNTPADHLISILNDLYQRKITGHLAVGTVNHFVSKYPEFEEIVYLIIDKDLKCKTGIGLINGVFNELIPQFSVALAEDFFKTKVNDLESGKWMHSRKLDGIRCITRIEGGRVSFWSREGNQFFTLSNLMPDIKQLGINDGILDGEICIVDEHGNEHFQEVQSEMLRVNHTIQRPRYNVFDVLTLEEFDSCTSKRTLLERIEPWYAASTMQIKFIIQEQVKSREQVDKLLDYAASIGWEGLILRKNVEYEGKRSKNMLKVKKFQDAEYTVKRVNCGDIDDGHGHKVYGLSSVTIEHKGNEVNVGSGWTFDQRIFYKDHPEELVGKKITVKYFAETKNQEGTFSLRFPIVKAVHGVKRVM